MSNETDTPRKSGQRRRRRSRGGKNRNNNQNRNQDQSNRSHGGSNSKGGGRPRSGKGRARGRKPIPLTWWQKLLKAVGLYKEPTRGKGGKPKSARSPKESTTRPPKSNTRNARGRTPEGESSRGRTGARKERRRGGDPSTVESSRIYMGNLSYDATEEDIKELFKGIGTVRRVEIVYNRNTHRSKGYGFVEMMNKEDAMRSVEVLHDQPFMGRSMTVSGAKSKAQAEDEDMDSAPQVKASEVELAPLPDPEPEPQAAEPEEPAKAPEPTPEAPAVAESPEPEPTDATAESEPKDDEQPKQA